VCYPGFELLKRTFGGSAVTKLIVVPIIPDSDIVRSRRRQLVVSLVEFKDETAGEGYGLAAVSGDCLIPEFLFDAFGTGDVEEAEHGGNVGIVSAVDRYFLGAELSRDNLLHFGDDGGGEGGALYFAVFSPE
jgi:hypothetical protein